MVVLEPGLKNSIKIAASSIKMVIFLTWNSIASGEWISSLSGIASADGTVIYCMALRIYTACSRARIYAFLSYTGFVIGAFRTHNALRFTTWGAANVVWETRADSLLVHFFALTVRTTRRWLTRIYFG